MNSHNFAYGEKKDPMSGEKYKKCVNCGQVVFIDNDDFVNMNCVNNLYFQSRESIRKRLENSEGANL